MSGGKVGDSNRGSRGPEVGGRVGDKSTGSRGEREDFVGGLSLRWSFSGESRGFFGECIVSELFDDRGCEFEVKSACDAEGRFLEKCESLVGDSDRCCDSGFVGIDLVSSLSLEIERSGVGVVARALAPPSRLFACAGRSRL
jgi:hypothetical protein